MNIGHYGIITYRLVEEVGDPLQGIEGYRRNALDELPAVAGKLARKGDTGALGSRQAALVARLTKIYRALDELGCG